MLKTRAAKQHSEPVVTEAARLVLITDPDGRPNPPRPSAPVARDADRAELERPALVLSAHHPVLPVEKQAAGPPARRAYSSRGAAQAHLLSMGPSPVPLSMHSCSTSPGGAASQACSIGCPSDEQALRLTSSTNPTTDPSALFPWKVMPRSMPHTAACHQGREPALHPRTACSRHFGPTVGRRTAKGARPCDHACEVLIGQSLINRDEGLSP